MIPLEAVQMLYDDVLRMASNATDPTAKAIARRVGLFHMMYVEGKELPNKGRKIVLLADGNVPYIADELQEDGRLHLMNEPKYAVFNRDDMTLDYDKVSLELIEVVYEGEHWPEELENPTYNSIIKHFFGEF